MNRRLYEILEANSEHKHAYAHSLQRYKHTAQKMSYKSRHTEKMDFDLCSVRVYVLFMCEL